MLSFRKLIKISRPRFWLYTGGPFLLGVAATGYFGELHSSYISLFAENNIQAIILLSLVLLTFLVMLDYFVFAANILIYGVNDIADGDTDQFNEKKGQYETLLREQEKIALASSIKKINIADLLIVIALFVCSVAWQSNIQTSSYRAEWGSVFREYRSAHGRQIVILFSLFFFFAIFYSAYPLRAKARPFLDGIFNVLYIIPGIIGYVMFGGSLGTVNWLMVIGARLRCMAMHAYSAIPDIHADKKAGLETTAVFLGRSNTLHYCGILRTVTAIILYILIGRYAILIALPYITLTILSFERSIMKLYKFFPWINAIVGFVLFWMIVLGN